MEFLIIGMRMCRLILRCVFMIISVRFSILVVLFMFFFIRSIDDDGLMLRLLVLNVIFLLISVIFGVFFLF